MPGDAEPEAVARHTPERRVDLRRRPVVVRPVAPRGPRRPAARTSSADGNCPVETNGDSVPASTPAWRSSAFLLPSEVAVALQPAASRRSPTSAAGSTSRSGRAARPRSPPPSVMPAEVSPIVRPNSATPMPAGDRDEAREQRDADVDHEQLGEGDVVAEAAREEPERGREEQLGGEAAEHEQRQLVRGAQDDERGADVGPPAPASCSTIAAPEPADEHDDEHARRRRRRRAIQRSVRSPPDGKGRSIASDDSEKTSSAPSRTAWTTVPTNESIAPDATAVGAERPWRWKKRMLTAIRARFDGSATFM